MKYGLVLPNFGSLGVTRVLVDLAHVADEAGWDGFFLWDTIQMQGTEASPASDPWIDLAAIAMRTERIRIGLLVAAPARYRPWILARQAATLDHLSNGRLILGVGAGDEQDRGFATFREEMSVKRRAAMLDESLEILQGLWSGQPFRHEGVHYQFDEISLLPVPVQAPRVPIWIGWLWPHKRPMERAARWDGAVPYAVDADGNYANLTAPDIRQLKLAMDERRTGDAPLDIVTYGPALDAVHDAEARATVRANAEAGATWTVEFIEPGHGLEDLRESVRKGPPSLELDSSTTRH
jgi:hypothetical protein